jgi:hypothetical protein
MKPKMQKALLFVNKKKQKNFVHFSAGHFQHRAKRSKNVFWFFFSKKNCFLPYFLNSDFISLIASENRWLSFCIASVFDF